ncbi:Crp/Fnr family transcriptional regulator [Belliella pelovolcani]|uniref:cAMP-binding domain of CRP or a regulatory subunit of cAMP-dependent protein kinases n=1 Tax=Belliella pelovolcani TaxID=529505 RepID=A0A1N7NE18_9BACT|nr:Crp/Fnr family transcriptional regulator [Belliella pelovolcani]SIS96653.1 cAMP-binding domain of CRP or a regulatory subunit of cAMP-dependent protein kinases [Belliella pelovolcani]
MINKDSIQHTSIINNLTKYVDFSEEELDKFFELGETSFYKKNQTLVHKGKESSPFILIKKGCLMTSYIDEVDFRHVIQFGIDNWWTGDLNSFMNNVPSIYSIKAMTDVEVLTWNKVNFDLLCASSPNFEKYFRILFQNSLISHQKRIIRNISFSAEQKYLTFLKNYPRLELIVPQKYIASYLGITPVFLSNLRKKLSGK